MPEHRCNAYLERVVNALVRSEERPELFLRWQRFWQCMRDKEDNGAGGARAKVRVRRTKYFFLGHRSSAAGDPANVDPPYRFLPPYHFR